MRWLLVGLLAMSLVGCKNPINVTGPSGMPETITAIEENEPVAGVRRWIFIYRDGGNDAVRCYSWDWCSLFPTGVCTRCNLGVS